MDIHDIVKKHLEDNGFGGLVDEYCECACFLGDLAPCGEFPHSCDAGYEVPCTPECDHGYEHAPAQKHIQLEKPEAKQCP